MAKKNNKPETLETTPASAELVPARLKPDSPYGRVVVGTVVVERTKPVDADWPLIPAAELERLSEEYGLEAVPADEE